MWVFSKARNILRNPSNKAVGALGMDLGLDWGGSWKTLADEPDFQLRPDCAQSFSSGDGRDALRSRQPRIRLSGFAPMARRGLFPRECLIGRHA